jgi:hypothetical protein
VAWLFASVTVSRLPFPPLGGLAQISGQSQSEERFLTAFGMTMKRRREKGEISRYGIRDREARTAMLGGCDFFDFSQKGTLKAMNLDAKKSP